MNQYIAIYNGKQFEVSAKSLWDAKQAAVDHFRPPRSKIWLVSVYLIKDSTGQDVNIIPQTY